MLNLLKTILKFVNTNHWYLFAGVILITAVIWTYGCESQCKSLINTDQLVNRSELQNELNYLVGLAKSREENLDKQDAVKQSLLDAANIIGSTGTINPSGLINLAATIGGISFGLTQRQKRIAATPKKTENTT
jgi:hypothetical protein